MKPEEYPSNVTLAQGLTKALGIKIEPDALRIQNEMRENITLQVVAGLSCTVKYQQPEEKSGKITVRLQPKKGNERKSEKEFDTTMPSVAVGEISAYFHVLPIHAFKSAVQAVLDN